MLDPQRELRASDLQIGLAGWQQEPLSPDEIALRDAIEAARQAEYARSQALMTISTVMAGSACTASHLINMAEEIAQYIQHGKPAREPVNLKPVEGT